MRSRENVFSHIILVFDVIEVDNRSTQRGSKCVEFHEQTRFQPSNRLWKFEIY